MIIKRLATYFIALTFWGHLITCAAIGPFRPSITPTANVPGPAVSGDLCCAYRDRTCSPCRDRTCSPYRDPTFSPKRDPDLCRRSAV